MVGVETALVVELGFGCCRCCMSQDTFLGYVFHIKHGYGNSLQAFRTSLPGHRCEIRSHLCQDTAATVVVLSAASVG